MIRLDHKPAPTRIFDPTVDTPDIGNGKRREYDDQDGLPLRWPTSKKERYDLFDAWHDVAMQIVHRKQGSFRLMAVTKKVINWSHGVIKASNSDLAERAGGCSEKTISRDVQQYLSLGILKAQMGWRRDGIQIIRTRILRPSLPAVLDSGIFVPDAVIFDLDNSGPDGMAADLDNSGPADLDNSGPITIETIRGGDAA